MALLLVVAACGAAEPDNSAPFGAVGTPLGVVMDPGGLSGPLDLPSGPQALWVRVGPARCATLADDGGRPAANVDALEDSGLFFIDQPGPWRLLHVDCVSGVRRRESVAVEARSAPRSTVTRGQLVIRLVLSQHSRLRGDVDAQRELIALLGSELASANVVPVLGGVEEISGVPQDLVFGPGALAPLRATLALAPPSPERVVDVVFAGCLRYDDPFFGPPSPVDGFTPRVVGGGAPTDAVFLPGRACDSFGAGAVPVDLEGVAHVLAHELGHFLGLRHTVELDGRTDTLDDTDAHNLMHPNPGLASSAGLSPSQALRMRSHPYIRASD